MKIADCFKIITVFITLIYWNWACTRVGAFFWAFDSYTSVRHSLRMRRPTSFISVPSRLRAKITHDPSTVVVQDDIGISHTIVVWCMFEHVRQRMRKEIFIRCYEEALVVSRVVVAAHVEIASERTCVLPAKLQALLFAYFIGWKRFLNRVTCLTHFPC